MTRTAIVVFQDTKRFDTHYTCDEVEVVDGCLVISLDGGVEAIYATGVWKEVTVEDDA